MGFKDGISKIFRLRRGQKKKAIKLALEPEESPSTMRSELYAMDIPARVEPLTIGVEKGFKVVESYPLEDPWARAVILQNPSTGETLYYVDEIQLTREEREVYKRLMDILYWELEPPKEGVDPREHFKKQAKSVIEKYRLKFMETISPAISWGKIYYYVIRDTVGYGPIDALMKDENIEDISCDGVGRPIYVWHRRYESIPTNIRFTSDEELDSLVIKLAHKAGKHVSVAFPIVDAILPGGHRLAATYKREVSMSGSTFTIRKFREKPLSIIDLLKGGTMSPDLAAYLWLAMEFKMTGLIMGVTGSGKTTTLNALTTLFRPTIKVVTIEDTPELRLTLENWVQLTARPSYGLESRRGEITLYDLVKVSLRYRPDVIIVGEVRGEEAKVLFQAIASVSWDTPILIRDYNGNVKLVKIGEFVDKFYKDEYEERIAKPVKGYWVLSHDGYKAVWKPIKYVLRHKTNKIYRVKYEGGGELKATGSHSVFVLDPETLNIEEKNVSELKPGDLLVTFIGPVSDHSNQYRNEAVTSLSTQMEPAISTYTTRVAGREQLLQVAHITHINSVFTNLLGRLDEDLAFIMGLYLADGCVKHHKGSRICITLGSRERRLAEKLLKIMKDRYKVIPTVTNRDTYTIYEFNRTWLAKAFEELMGGKLKEKRVPDILWNVPRGVVRAFFEGLRADSRRSLRRRYVNYSTTNKRLAVELVWLARLHGWYASLHRERGSGRNRNKGRIFYNVNIYFNNNYRKPNASERIPSKALQKLIELAKPKSMPLELTYIKRRKFISLKVAEKVLAWVASKGRLEGEALELYYRILAYMNGQIRAVEVREIRVEKYDGFVYDISVPDTESFFGGDVPVLLHNTGHGGLTTIHAESIDAAVKRLTSSPMDIPPSYIPLMNFALVVKRIRLQNPDGTYRVVRRVTDVWEIRDYNDYPLIAKWDPRERRHVVFLDRSKLLESIGEEVGEGLAWALEEVEKRSVVLRWMMREGITDYRHVASIIQEYYARPEETYEKARNKLKRYEAFG